MKRVRLETLSFSDVAELVCSTATRSASASRATRLSSG